MLKSQQFASGLIASFRDFGLLVKSWATGTNYLSHRQYAKAPWALKLTPQTVKSDAVKATVHGVVMTKKDFKGLLETANRERYFLNDITALQNVNHVVIVQGDDHTMVVRLPPKDTVIAAEKAFKGGGTYEIPGFYDALYKDPHYTRNNARQLLPTTPDGKLELQASRIGDYTIGNCN